MVVVMVPEQGDGLSFTSLKCFKTKNEKKKQKQKRERERERGNVMKK